MTTINSSAFKIDNLHAKVLEKAAENLGTSGQNVGFSDRMQNALNDVADAQKHAANSMKAFDLGLENDLSKVMVDQQVSSLGFQLTLNVRNKMLSAYKDILNMPV
jgi:flagellar hook-basal body complex protein FliE